MDNKIAGMLTAFLLGFGTLSQAQSVKTKQTNGQKGKSEMVRDSLNNNKTAMKLGAFSVSLSVKDLSASKTFYENLGFVVFGGAMEQNYLIMKNGNALIGLFQGMFSGNILTFNPGWDENAQNMAAFDDVRTIQQQLKSKGVAVSPEADEKTTGPASFMIMDPDGNAVLFDQHR